MCLVPHAKHLYTTYFFMLHPSRIVEYKVARKPAVALCNLLYFSFQCHGSTFEGVIVMLGVRVILASIARHSKISR